MGPQVENSSRNNGSESSDVECRKVGSAVVGAIAASCNASSSGGLMEGGGSVADTYWNVPCAQLVEGIPGDWQPKVPDHLTPEACNAYAVAAQGQSSGQESQGASTPYFNRDHTTSDGDGKQSDRGGKHSGNATNCMGGSCTTTQGVNRR